MLYRKRPNVERLVQRDAVGQLLHVDSRRELVERDGKDDGRHLVADDATEARLHRLGAPDRKVVSLLEHRGEEWQTLDVVPVRVREEDVPTDRLPVRAVDQRATELANARAGVQDDQEAIRRAYFEARRVPAIAHGLGARAGYRATRAPEPYGERHRGPSRPIMRTKLRPTRHLGKDGTSRRGCDARHTIRALEPERGARRGR